MIDRERAMKEYKMFILTDQEWNVKKKKKTWQKIHTTCSTIHLKNEKGLDVKYVMQLESPISKLNVLHTLFFPEHHFIH